MAGTLTISTLSDGTNSTSSTNCIQGSAKAWARWNGTGTVAIGSSYNVSSITRPSTGLYQINFTNALADANYGFVSQASYPTVANVFAQGPSFGSNTATASIAFVGTENLSTTNVDVSQISFTAFR